MYVYYIMLKGNGKSLKKNSYFNNQDGGRVTMPSEYFGKNSGRYFETGSPELTIADSAYGKNFPTSRGILIENNVSGPELGPTSSSGIQTGGRVTMPSEYFGNDSGRYYETGSPELNISNSAYGKNVPTSRGIIIDNNVSGPDLGPTSSSGIQTGGAFQYITNPQTNRKVNINGKIGKKILNNYIKNLYEK